MKSILLFVLCCAFALVFVSAKENDKNTLAYQSWVTTANKSMLLAPYAPEQRYLDEPSSATIEVDAAKHYQSMDGFGYALTGGSAMLMNTKLSKDTRAKLLKELFLDDNGIGISYLRISIGASDLDDHVFTYDDLKDGETDPTLKKFSLDEDRKNLIPVLKEILALNPNIKILGSPWSAPAWMKSNNSLKGGSLKKDSYQAFADYFVRYISEMKKEGINIDAVTLQNEPENPKNNPSMLMTAEEQAAFVKNSLGPAFAKAGIKTRIIVFDHNCDHPDYPIAVLNDADARKYIDGSAFHLYLGDIDAMSKTHEAHPDKNVYFTEQWTSPRSNFGGDLKWHVKNLIIGASRNWSKNVLEWNLAADPSFNPHTDKGGCDSCLGALTIGNSVTRNVSYYVIAHASKFVKPGSIRVSSTAPSDLPNVVFSTPDKKKVMIVSNESKVVKVFTIKEKDKEIKAVVPAEGVATIVW